MHHSDDAITTPEDRSQEANKTHEPGRTEPSTSVPYKKLLANRKRTASKRGESKRPAAKRELTMKRRQTKCVDDSESWFCSMCGETRQENMVRCCGCKQWVHVACADDPHSQFRCHDCDQM